MNNFHYNQDPLYDVIQSILTGETMIEASARTISEGVGNYGVKKTGSRVEKGKQSEPDVTTTYYDILKDGKKIGKLNTNDFTGNVNGSMYGKDLPDLEGYGSWTSSGVLGNLHKFIKSNTGKKWIEKNIKEDFDKDNETVVIEGAAEVAAIADAVTKFKVGDLTNFGKVVEIGSDSITFKAKDLPKTRIKFNQRKVGSSEYVLSKLINLKEDTLEEAIDWDVLQTLYLKDIIGEILVFGGAATAATVLLAKEKIKNWIASKKKQKETDAEAALVKSALDKIKKNSKAQDYVDQLKELPYVKGAGNSERSKVIKLYKSHLKQILNDEEYALIEQLYTLSLKEESLEEATNWIISVSAFKGAIEYINDLKKDLVDAEKEYDNNPNTPGHGSGHYQIGRKIESITNSLKKYYSGLIEIQQGLLERGEMTSALQKQYIDVLEKHVSDLEDAAKNRTDNNYIVKTQLKTRKDILSNAKKELSSLKEDMQNIVEVLNPDDEASVWIDDFVNSTDPKFDDKSKEERIKMALGAWYAAQKKESVSSNEKPLSEETDYARFKQLAIMGLIEPGEVNKIIAGMKALEAGKTISQEQKNLINVAFLSLASIITGDTTVLSKVKQSLKSQGGSSDEEPMQEANSLPRGNEDIFDLGKEIGLADSEISKLIVGSLKTHREPLTAKKQLLYAFKETWKAHGSKHQALLKIAKSGDYDSFVAASFE
jgi:hypothetical protein